MRTVRLLLVVLVAGVLGVAMTAAGGVAAPRSGAGSRSSAAAPVRVAWSVPVHGRIADVATLPGGAVVVVGQAPGPSKRFDWQTEVGFVARYRPDGTEVWRRSWRLGHHGWWYGWSPVTAVAVAGDGTIFAAGFVYCGGGAGGNGVALVRRYSRSGRLSGQWSSRPRSRWCDESAVWQQYPSGAAVARIDGHPLVLVSGSAYRLGDPSFARGWLRAFDGRLHQRWIHQLSVGRYRADRDRADAVAAIGGPRPVVYLAGSVHTSRTHHGDRGNEDLVVQRLTAAGATRWTRVRADRADGTVDHDYATGIVATAHGPLLSAVLDRKQAPGWYPDVLTSPDGRGWVGRLSGRGGQVWQTTWPDGSGAAALVRGPARHVGAAGVTDLAGRAKATARSYGRGGRPLWTWTGPQANRIGTALAAGSHRLYLAEISGPVDQQRLSDRSWLLRLEFARLAATPAPTVPVRRVAPAAAGAP